MHCGSQGLESEDHFAKRACAMLLGALVTSLASHHKKDLARNARWVDRLARLYVDSQDELKWALEFNLVTLTYEDVALPALGRAKGFCRHVSSLLELKEHEVQLVSCSVSPVLPLLSICWA